MVPSLCERLPLDPDDVPAQELWPAASDDAHDYLEAIAAVDHLLHLNSSDDPASRVARPILSRAQQHLATRLHRYLIPAQRPDTEAQARALLKKLVGELAYAGEHLKQVADLLHVKGFGKGAHTAREASIRAFKAAEGLR